MLRRTDQGNHFPLISAVNAEVLAIHRNDTVPGKEFAQANQAQIGQIGMTTTLHDAEKPLRRDSVRGP